MDGVNVEARHLRPKDVVLAEGLVLTVQESRSNRGLTLIEFEEFSYALIVDEHEVCVAARIGQLEFPTTADIPRVVALV
jgi:hypothetical protein